MNAAHKSENPAATGFNATQSTNLITITPAETIGNAAYLIAKLALAGHSVHRDGNDDFLVSKWGQSRYCKSFDALLAFARQVGAEK